VSESVGQAVSPGQPEGRRSAGSTSTVGQTAAGRHPSNTTDISLHTEQNKSKTTNAIA